MRLVFMMDNKKPASGKMRRPPSAKLAAPNTPIEIDGALYTTSSGSSLKMVGSSGSSLKMVGSSGSSIRRTSSAKRGSRKRSKSRSKSEHDQLNKSVTWAGMASYGYANVIDTFKDYDKLDHTMELKEKNWTAGTLGSGKIRERKQYTSIEYVQDVKTTFARKYSVYQEFIRILSEIKDPSSDKIEIIKRIIILFEGYPHLIEGFNFFLPDNIVIEVQDDAVVVKVDEDIKTISHDSDDDEDDTPTMRYIRNVKWTYSYHPEVYPKFSHILKKFHNKTLSEVDTIHKITALFQDHPDLVLGFNFFLPAGYKVLADKRHGYVIQHPAKKGMKPQYTPVIVD